VSPRRWLGAGLAGLGLLLLLQGGAVHAKARLAQHLLERAFARSLETGQAERPWSWADSWPEARIEIPRLGLSQIVLAGDSGQALAFGPGHVPGTAEVGREGVTVFAAHRDTHFRALAEIALDDLIRVTRRDGQTFEFRVTGTEVVRWNASGIEPRQSGRELVLATCWPFDAVTPGPLRYLVRAAPVEATSPARLPG
jgi:sortase A